MQTNATMNAIYIYEEHFAEVSNHSATRNQQLRADQKKKTNRKKVCRYELSCVCLHIYFWLISFSWRKTPDMQVGKKCFEFLRLDKLLPIWKCSIFVNTTFRTHVKVIIARFHINFSVNLSLGSSLFIDCYRLALFIFDAINFIIIKTLLGFIVFSIICFGRFFLRLCHHRCVVVRCRVAAWECGVNAKNINEYTSFVDVTCSILWTCALCIYGKRHFKPEIQLIMTAMPTLQFLFDVFFYPIQFGFLVRPLAYSSWSVMCAFLSPPVLWPYCCCIYLRSSQNGPSYWLLLLFLGFCSGAIVLLLFAGWKCEAASLAINECECEKNVTRSLILTR